MKELFEDFCYRHEGKIVVLLLIIIGVLLIMHSMARVAAC